MMPDATHPITETKSFSITDMNNADNAISAKMPERIVRKSDPAKPMTFSRAFDTIDFSILCLSIVKLDYVYPLVPVRKGWEPLFKGELQPLFFVCGYGRS